MAALLVGVGSFGAAKADQLQDLLGQGKSRTPSYTNVLHPADTPDAANKKVEAPVILPPEPPTDFQQLVAQSVGHGLPIFGMNLFSGAPSTFAPVDKVPVTSDYVVGPGDEILLRVWGQVDMDLKLPVDRNGSVYIPEVGNVSVVGTHYQDLSDHLKKSLSRVFRNFELNASLGQLRSIQVFVVGQARRPGSYTVSSLSTLVNTLFTSGGPSSKGSLRNIQVKRGNRVVTTFDLYDLLLKGDKSRDVQLLPGDVIYIPTVGRQVAIFGGVRVPALYELKEKNSLADLIEWAGGLDTNAAGQKVTVERIDDRSARKVDEFELSKASGVMLHDGDLVNVYTLSPRIDNAITLRGNVAQPMRFPWHAGMRITDIIPDKNALIVPGYWVNKKSDAHAVSWLAKRRDADRFSSDRTAALGAQEDAVTGQKKLLDEIRYSENEVNWDYASIERMRPDLSTELIPFNLGKVILEGDQAQNVVLQPGDVITVFSKSDILVPQSRQTVFVRLEGEFRHSGVYRVEPGETLRQVILRSGGLSPNAYVYGMQLTRESTRVQQQAKMDEVVSRMEKDLERSAAQRQASATGQQDAASTKLEVETQQKLMDKIRAAKASGRIVLEMDPQSAGVQSIPDVPLEDGDRVLVPAIPGTVSVFGSVYNENAFLYKPNKRMSDYLAQSGGPTKDADESAIFVIRADGSVESKQQKSWFSSFANGKMMPGDAIVVPENFDKFSWMKELKDWSQIIYQFALGGAALKTIKP